MHNKMLNLLNTCTTPSISILPMPDQERFQYFALHRTQWVGLMELLLPMLPHHTLNESNLGLGVTIINDKIGPTTENTISTDVSYTVPTSETLSSLWN
jgi:hypothetical protein